MSIFFRAINELKRVPQDENPTEYENISGERKPPVNTSSDDTYELPDNNEEGRDDNPEDDTINPDNPEDETEDDYSLDSEDTDPSDELDNEEPPTDDESLTPEEDSELQQLEDEIFSNLKDSEKSIRDKELIKSYIDLYNDIDNTISKLNAVPKTQALLQPLDYCIRKITEVRDIMYSYILSSYNTKTYIENMSNYYEFLATLNIINNIIIDLKEKNEDKE